LKLKIKIPKDQSDITLNQFQKYLVVAEKEENKNTFFLKQKMLEIFCDIPLTVIYTMKKKDIDDIANSIGIILAQENVKFDRTFKVNDVEFGFMPNFEEMTAGEYSDLTQYIGDWSNMHRAMAVLFRPIDLKKKEKYTIQKYNGTDKYANAMKSLPLNRVTSAVFFLPNTLAKLINDFPDYLRDLMRNNPKLSGVSMKDMDGIVASMRLAASVFSTSMKLPK